MGCVLAEEEAALLHAAARDDHHLRALVVRRADGTPLEVVLGRARFHGVEVAVTARVFVPRRRSDHLVEETSRPARWWWSSAAGLGDLGAPLPDRLTVVSTR